MERKAFSLDTFSLDANGSFAGYAAVFGNVDAGGEIIAPGAFAGALPDFLRDGFVAWGHDWAEIVAIPTEAYEDQVGLHLAGIFHSTPRGQEARTIAGERLAAGKRMGLSIGYAVARDSGPTRPRTLHEIAPLYEVSLVAVPMNREANLVAVKAAKTAIPPHSTPVSDADWDAGAAVARLASEREVLRAVHAWVDPAAEPDVKWAYKFPHHAVDAAGRPGAAVVAACRAGIAVLNGARGGADIPDADRAGVHDHLSRHLIDAEVEPAALRGLVVPPGLVVAALAEEARHLGVIIPAHEETAPHA